MKCNVGKIEQIFRIVSGVAVIILGLLFRNWWGLLGLVLIITGFIRYCPINAVFGVSTCDAKRKQ